jgi:hypothetical protein|nr:MAG TPA: Thaumarchaeal output domain 1 [Caudoviricetes sp.]
MTNRQEVAKKLCEAGENIEEVSPYPAVVLNEITNIIAINEITSYQDFFNRLADLIDPTCTADIKREDDGIDAQPYYTSSCGNCGALWDTITGAALLPKYCPHCGARVVR